MGKNIEKKNNKKVSFMDVEEDNPKKNLVTLKSKRSKLIMKEKQVMKSSMDLETKKKQRIRSKKHSNTIQKITQQNPSSIFKEFQITFNKKFEPSNSNQKKLKKHEILKQKQLKKKEFVKFLKNQGVNQQKQDTNKNIDLQEIKQNVEVMMKEEEINQKQKNQKLSRGVSNSQKSKISQNEVQRMQQILKFPVFQNNPLDTIKQHIINSQKQNK